MAFPSNYNIPENVSSKYNKKMKKADDFIAKVKKDRDICIITNKTKSSFYFTYKDIAFRVSLHKLPNLGYKFGNSDEPFRVWNSKHHQQQEIILEHRDKVYDVINSILEK